MFKLEDSTHELLYDQPVKLAELMIAFFDQTVKGKFETKPKYEIACAPFPMPTFKPNQKLI